MCPETSIETSLKQDIEEKAQREGVPEMIPLLIELLTSPINDHAKLQDIMKKHLIGEDQDE